MKPTLYIAITFLIFLYQNRVLEHKISNKPFSETNSFETMLQEQDTLGIHRYGEKIAGLLKQSDWPAILEEIHAINMPGGWEEMIKPSFEPYFGKELSVEAIPFETLPGYQLKWLNKAPPEILAKTKWAIRLSYDDSTEDETNKGKLELAVYEKTDGFSILVVGGQ